MWLVGLNYFLSHGFLEPGSDGLRIHADRCPAVVEAMLGEVLALLDGGEKGDAAAFIARYSTWDARHEAIATAVKSVERYRFARYVYPILRGSASSRLRS
jgi:hypothetical protein